MIETGYYTIDDIKSFFKDIRVEDEYDDDFDLLEGEILEISVGQYPNMVVMLVEVLEVSDNNYFTGYIIQVSGNSRKYREGNIVNIPYEIL
jgi:hypothetical protein